MKTVRDAMNPELVSLMPQARCEEARRYLSFLGMHAAPVVDEERRVVGVLSLPDLLGDLSGATVADRMSAPALSVREDSSLELAEAVMVDSGFHHLAVVDTAGRAVGFVSALDLMRARMGRPVVHPGTAPLLVSSVEDAWSQDKPFDAAGIADVPHQPGQFILVAGGDLVWTENCHDLHDCLAKLLREPNDRVAFFCAGAQVEFRVAVLGSGPHRVLGAQG